MEGDQQGRGATVRRSWGKPTGHTVSTVSKIFPLIGPVLAAPTSTAPTATSRAATTATSRAATTTASTIVCLFGAGHTHNAPSLVPRFHDQHDDNYGSTDSTTATATATTSESVGARSDLH